MVLDFGQEITGWIVAEFLKISRVCDSNSANYYKWGFYTENRTAKQEFVINNVSKGIKVRPSFSPFWVPICESRGLTQEEAALVVAQSFTK